MGAARTSRGTPEHRDSGASLVTLPLAPWHHPGDPDAPTAVEVCAGLGPADTEYKIKQEGNKGQKELTEFKQVITSTGCFAIQTSLTPP